MDIYINDASGEFNYKGSPSGKVSLKENQERESDKIYRGFNLGVYELSDIEVLEFKDAAQKAILESKEYNVKKELEKIDMRSIRALRAGDAKYIARLEKEAVELRKKLK